MELHHLEQKLDESPEKALVQIDTMLKENPTKELFMLRMNAHQKLNNLTEAVNDCIDILRIYGSDAFVENQKAYFETIISHSQLDIYACTNLHNDPWD
ncbi:MAG: hypothetical protein JXR34_11095 [Bacteroidales bacterium]|nr:hypothetical protein [Bacteroidales bacterium]